MIVGIYKMMCHKCDKVRIHETMLAFAKCVICQETRTHENEPIEIERFVD